VRSMATAEKKRGRPALPEGRHDRNACAQAIKAYRAALDVLAFDGLVSKRHGLPQSRPLLDAVLSARAAAESAIEALDDESFAAAWMESR
jgi:hypothetical protein